MLHVLLKGIEKFAEAKQHTGSYFKSFLRNCFVHFVMVALTITKY